MKYGVRVAAVTGALFGGLAVVAGTRVMTGIDIPDYAVLPWLVRYNVIAGAFGVAVGVGLWARRRWAMTAAFALAAVHAAVLVLLAAQRVLGGAVADDSLVAMTLRTLVWSGIAWVASRGARSLG